MDGGREALALEGAPVDPGLVVLRAQLVADGREEVRQAGALVLLVIEGALGGQQPVGAAHLHQRVLERSLAQIGQAPQGVQHDPLVALAAVLGELLREEQAPHALGQGARIQEALRLQLLDGPPGSLEPEHRLLPAPVRERGGSGLGAGQEL